MMLEEDHPQQGGVMKQLTPGMELFTHNSTSWTVLLSFTTTAICQWFY